MRQPRDSLQQDHHPNIGRDHQIRLGVTDETLNYAFRLRILGMTEIRREPVVRSEPDIGSCWDHNIRDDTRFQTAHPIREDLRGHTPQHLETFSKETKCRCRGLISRETYEPDP